MNAIKFIKDHGVEKARECIDEANAYGGFWVNAKTLELSKQIPSYDAVSIPDIQRLVGSVDLVGKVGGISQARYFYGSFECVHIGLDLVTCRALGKAIADYEQLFGNTETLGGG